VAWFFLRFNVAGNHVLGGKLVGGELLSQLLDFGRVDRLGEMDLLGRREHRVARHHVQRLVVGTFGMLGTDFVVDGCRSVPTD
jgi:hypothetical protein